MIVRNPLVIDNGSVCYRSVNLAMSSLCRGGYR